MQNGNAARSREIDTRIPTLVRHDEQVLLVSIPSTAIATKPLAAVAADEGNPDSRGTRRRTPV